MSTGDEVDQIAINLYGNYYNWRQSLINLKHSKVRRFSISGSTPAVAITYLSKNALKVITEEAIRLNCNEMFIFNQLDFNEFDYYLLCSLPVKNIRIDDCSNVDLFIPQIFNSIIGKYDKSYKVQHLIFTYLKFPPDRYIKFFSKMELALRNNYQFRSIRYENVGGFSKEQLARIEESKRDINKLLRRNLALRKICQDSILTLLLIRQFRKDSLINILPRDVLLIIIRILLKELDESIYLLGFSGKVDTIRAEYTYYKLMLPKGHQELLTIRSEIEPLKDLKRKKFTLGKLVILFSPTPNGKNLNEIFSLIVKTRLNILEIQHEDFATIYKGDGPDRLQKLKGDDSTIGEIMNYPEPALTKIYLWGCKNIPIFQLCFLKLMNKGDKYGKYNYQAVKNFNYDMVKVTIFNIDRISNRIDISSED